MNRSRAVFLALVAPVLALLVLGRFRLPASEIAGTFFDDFFYYAVIARNWGVFGFPTFDGHTPTNGVQPLWMGIVGGLMAALGDGWAFFAAMSAIPWLCGVFVADRLWALGGRLGAPADLRAMIAFVTAFWTVVLSSTGMEVCLVIALVVACLEPDVRPVFVGSFGALAVLARLDAIVLVLPLLALHANSRDLRMWVGWAPVLVYFGLNRVFFHTFLPISGAAKQLGAPHVPTVEAIARLVYFDGIGPLFVSAALVMGASGAVVAARRGASRPEALSAMVLGLGPLWFYAIQLVMTDWLLWFWYAWPLVVGLGVGGMYVAAGDWDLVPRSALRAAWLIAAMWASLYAVDKVARPDPVLTKPAWALGTTLSGIDLPGRWAMGDLAGTMAWLSHREVVQTEGLVMGSAFLDAIRDGVSLGTLLRRNEVDWYVGRRGRQTQQAVYEGASMSMVACNEYREPFKAGPASPALVVRICGEPEASVELYGETWDVWAVSALPP